MNLTDINNNGRAPSENDMNNNDNIAIVKPDQRSALDRNRKLTIAQKLSIKRRKKISVQYYEKPVEMFTLRKMYTS